jgi:hypothetical protein
MEHLPEKAASSKKSQPKREAKWANGQQGHRDGAAQSFWNLHPTNIQMPNIELQESMFAFLGFGHIPPPYAPIPPFWNGNIYSVPLYVGRIQHVF